jgi:ATP-dependent Clp protease ATP-binding subunit ClpC
VLELALRESPQFGDDSIGTHQILRGLIGGGDGVAAQVLVKLGTERGSRDGFDDSVLPIL